jgi:hypothetical protein
MRITRETLLKIARDTAAQRVRVSRRIQCIYLTGSCLAEEPLLGGTGDIDLVIIEDGQPLQPREIVRLNDEVSLDISHYAQEDFQQPRHLRADPWLGPILYNKPLVLYDSNHWFDYIQASSGALFLQPDNVLLRATRLAENARSAWIELGLGGQSDHVRKVYAYLRCLENAGNAFASLSGVPLTERRFLLELPRRAAALQQTDLSANMLLLLSGEVEVGDADWQAWMEGWEAALVAVAGLETCPVRLSAARRLYYTRAAAALWNEHPSAAFWILVRTWAVAAAHLAPDAPGRQAFESVLSAAALTPGRFETRLEELDHYLDRVEETLERWGHQNGVTTA